MRLVDAIRQATIRTQNAACETSAEQVDFAATSEVTEAEIQEVQAAIDQGVAPNGSTLVRLEMFLTQEQVYSLLRGALASSRSVMTLKEVATYLRLSTHTVEQMAAEGEIPAFRVHDSWRFARAEVDQWLNNLSNRMKMGGSDAA